MRYNEDDCYTNLVKSDQFLLASAYIILLKMISNKTFLKIKVSCVSSGCYEILPNRSGSCQLLDPGRFGKIS